MLNLMWYLDDYLRYFVSPPVMSICRRHYLYFTLDFNMAGVFIQYRRTALYVNDRFGLAETTKIKCAHHGWRKWVYYATIVGMATKDK